MDVGNNLKNRLSDLKKIIDRQNQRKITRIHTAKMRQELLQDLKSIVGVVTYDLQSEQLVRPDGSPGAFHSAIASCNIHEEGALRVTSALSSAVKWHHSNSSDAHSPISSPSTSSTSPLKSRLWYPVRMMP